MMRAMREITKPVFWVVAVSFIGWMAYGQITDIVGGGRDVVLKVDGTIVRSQPFQQQYQATLEQYRRQQGGGRLSREDERQVQDRVVDQFIQKILLDRAYGRFGITVSDDEIIQAARSSPPPQILQQVLQDPTFQTNGQFDITKWQRYISSAGPEFASQVEQLYREYLPQRKLEEYLTADLYVSDAKLWRTWRDQHESVTVALLAVHPEEIPDSLAPVSDAELERYYGVRSEEHTSEPQSRLHLVCRLLLEKKKKIYILCTGQKRISTKVPSTTSHVTDISGEPSTTATLYILLNIYFNNDLLLKSHYHHLTF